MVLVRRAQTTVTRSSARGRVAAGVYIKGKGKGKGQPDWTVLMQALTHIGAGNLRGGVDVELSGGEARLVMVTGQPVVSQEYAVTALLHAGGETLVVNATDNEPEQGGQPWTSAGSSDGSCGGGLSTAT